MTNHIQSNWTQVVLAIGMLCLLSSIIPCRNLFRRANCKDTTNWMRVYSVRYELQNKNITKKTNKRWSDEKIKDSKPGTVVSF